MAVPCAPADQTVAFPGGGKIGAWITGARVIGVWITGAWAIGEAETCTGAPDGCAAGAMGCCPEASGGKTTRVQNTTESFLRIELCAKDTIHLPRTCEGRADLLRQV